MTKLLFGVDDVPYVNPPAVKQARKARKGGWRKFVKRVKRAFGGGSGAVTTGQVSDILEAKYGVMAFFGELHGQDIADDLAKSYAGSLETLLMGGPAGDPMASATQSIENRFRQFIDNREMDYKVPGVPTQVSLDGKSKRFKHAYAKRGESRASFYDTGLYQSHFRAQVKP